MPLSTAIHALRQQSIVDEQMYALLDDLRVIGNRAAHGSAENEFSKEEALRYGKLTDDIIGQIRFLS